MDADNYDYSGGVEHALYCFEVCTLLGLNISTAPSLWVLIVETSGAYIRRLLVSS